MGNPRALLAAAGLLVLFWAGCEAASSAPETETPAAPPNASDSGVANTPMDAASSDASAPPPVDGGTPPRAFPVTCGALTAGALPPSCPPPSGTPGQADFCFRPSWPGVTTVEVFGAFGTSTDWKSAFATLQATSTGLFVGHAQIANGTYPYLFRVKGSTDDLIAYDIPDQHTNRGLWMEDLQNSHFVQSPPGSPFYSSTPLGGMQKFVSSLTVPQVADAVHDLHGVVTFNGVPQPCYTIEVRAGGPRAFYSLAANFAETGPDGTFHFAAADGPAYVTAQFPFYFDGDGGYPQVSNTPVVGFAQTGAKVAGADTAIDPLDVFVDYAPLSPPPNSTSVPLPVTFNFALPPNVKSAAVGVNSYTFPGGDPLVKYGPYGTATSFTFDGGGNYGPVTAGKQYYWAVWENIHATHDGGTGWNTQTLSLPITFQ
jgi:hypothetical protein